MIKVEVHHELDDEKSVGQKVKDGVVWMELHLHVKEILFICNFVDFRKEITVIAANSYSSTCFQ